MTTKLGIVRYALTQYDGTKDWRRIISSMGDKGCKIIIDNRSCINVVSFNIIACLGINYVPRSKSYSMSWINNTFIPLQERCIFPIKLLNYHDEILVWCDSNEYRTCYFGQTMDIWYGHHNFLSVKFMFFQF